MSEVRVGPVRDEDLSALASLLSVSRPMDRAYDAAALRAVSRADPQAMLVSAVLDGRVVGGALARAGGEWRQPDAAYMVPAFIVDAPHRRRGIGAAIAEYVESRAFAAGARRVVTSTRADAEDALRFLTRRGFKEFHREAWSLLDLSAWDAGRFARTDAPSEAGATVVALGEVLARDEEQRRPLVAKINAAHHELLADLPRSEVAFPRRGVDEYERALRHFDPDASLVALQGDEIVALLLARGGTTATILVAGEVGRGRGRKLIVALKLRAIEALRRAGAQRVGSIFDRDNAVTRQLNRSLGFVRQPPLLRLELRR